MRFDDFIGRLKGVKINSSGYMACCPAHEDRNPSLSISQGKSGRILLKCHAGCSQEDVVGGMDLSMADLFEENDRPTKFGSELKESRKKKSVLEPKPIDPQIIEQTHQALSKKTREYLKRERMLSEEVIDRYKIGTEERRGEKRITIPIADESGNYCDIRSWLPPQARTEGSSKIIHWETGYGGPRLYPITQLQEDELVLCEGELDALALIAHGIPTLTATCGVSTWPDSLSKRFSGKRVTVIMDHDEPGVKGAQKRTESLAKNSAIVRLVKWPEDREKGWDVTDELKVYGIESLRQILEASEPSFVTFDTPPGAGIQDFNWPDPQPLPAKLPAVESFDPTLLPEAFCPWIQDVAERMQCPPDFPAVASIVALSAVVGRQLSIWPQQQDDWTVVPNLWGAVVGRPGVLKTPAIQEPLKALNRLEARAREQHESELKRHEAEQLVAEERKKLSREGIKKALKSRQDPHELAMEAVSEEVEPVRQRYVVNDTTVEKLGEILNANPRGVLLFRDELTGFLKSLDREGREGDRSFYLEAWNGIGRFTYDRIGRGTVDIEAACVSILGGIQPGPLTQYLRRIVRGGADDDGLLQRFQMVVWPDLSSTWTNYDRKPDLQARKEAYAVFDRLNNIDPVILGAHREEGALPYLRFTPEAQIVFTEWRSELERRIRSGEESDLFEAHLAKYRSLVPSLALLIHLADGGRGQVGETALIRACAWGEYLESHARRIYAPVLSPAASSAHALSHRLKSGDLGKIFTLREVYRKHWQGLTTREEAQEAVDVLEELNWLREVQEKTEGRSAARYDVNPKLLEGDDGKVD